MKRTLLTLVMSLASATAVMAQNESAHHVLKRFEAGAVQNPGFAFFDVSSLLSQESVSARPATLDSVADGLVTLAIRPVTSVNDRMLTVSAVSAIAAAGSRDARVPYPGALQRLQRIIAEAQNPGSRAVAVDGVGKLAHSEPALAFLIKLATADDLLATAAVAAIAKLPAGTGQDVLLRLDHSGSVKNIHARDFLRQIAAHGYTYP